VNGAWATGRDSSREPELPRLRTSILGR
jgi:hypothetical protein